MEHLDKLIPLGILGAVAGLLVFLLRRTIRQENTPFAAEDPPVVAPAPVKIVGPLPASAQAATAVVETKVRKRKLRKVLEPAFAESPMQAPIVTVLDLLKQKDTLAAAFLLRAILAPPLSKR